MSHYHDSDDLKVLGEFDVHTRKGRGRHGRPALGGRVTPGVRRKGKLATALVNRAEHERLKETGDVVGDLDLMRQIRASRRYFAKGRRGLSFEDVFGEPIAPAKRPAR